MERLLFQPDPRCSKRLQPHRSAVAVVFCVKRRKKMAFTGVGMSAPAPT